MKSRRIQSGFTLIEIMIVVTIIGLLTAGAMLSFARPLRAAQTREAIEILRNADADARRASRSFDRPVTLVIDLSRGTIERREAGHGATYHAALPGSVRIDEVRINGGQTGFDDASIVYSPLGLSQTYALKIVGSEAGAEPRWLVFAGLGGQMSVFNDEATVQQILSQSR